MFIKYLHNHRETFVTKALGNAKELSHLVISDVDYGNAVWYMLNKCNNIVQIIKAHAADTN